MSLGYAVCHRFLTNSLSETPRRRLFLSRVSSIRSSKRRRKMAYSYNIEEVPMADEPCVEHDIRRAKQFLLKHSPESGDNLYVIAGTGFRKKHIDFYHPKILGTTTYRISSQRYSRKGRKMLSIYSRSIAEGWRKKDSKPRLIICMTYTSHLCNMKMQRSSSRCFK